MESGYLILILVFVFIVISVFTGIRDKRALKRRIQKAIGEGYGKKPQIKYDAESMQRIPRYFETHRSDYALDDITWNDLDMDDVFVRVNYCMSAAGEEVLYAMLRNVCDHTKSSADTYEKMEAQLQLLAEDGYLRASLQEAYTRIGKTGKYSVHDYLSGLENLQRGSMAKEIASLALIALSFVLMFFVFPIGAMLCFGMFVYQLVSFYKRKAQIEPYLVCFDYILRILKQGDTIQGLIVGKMPEEEAALRAMLKQMQAFRRGSSLVRAGMYGGGGATGSFFDIIMDYVNILFHLNLIKFNQMLAEVDRHADTIDALVTLTGRIEAYISIVCYRASLKGEDGAAGYCTPIFVTENVYAVEGLQHPLLDAAVPSSVTTDKNLLITGSNASGKSTFLKAAALCAVMGETLHTCRALRYSAPVYRVYSSMALKDDIHGGDSYYMVEIKSIKRILDAVKDASAPPVFACIDEVLRGTNTVERIAASTEILKTLATDGVRCMAATHDVELATLLKDAYENYHFEGVVEDGDVRFDFTLHEGASTTRNAIALLDLLGYEKSITEAAECRAQGFLEGGRWG